MSTARACRTTFPACRRGSQPDPPLRAGAGGGRRPRSRRRSRRWTTGTPTDSSHPADQFAANTALGSAVEIMYGEVADAGKSTESIETQHTEFLSRQDIILRTAGNEYNPAVEEYNNTLSSFPANVIGTLWGIGEVEAFQ